MQSGNSRAVYNARNPHMRAPSSRFPRAACFIALMLVYAPVVLANDWRGPEERLARKITAVTGPGAVAVDVVNRSSLRHSDIEEIRRGLLTELAALGVRSAPADQAAATVRITLSENLQSYVWVAEIQQGNAKASVVLVATPGLSSGPVESPEGAVTIHKTLLWADENRILDIALVNSSPQRMIVLEPEGAVVFNFQDGRPQQEQLLPIPHSRPWPRDLRGRLALRRDQLFDAYLPGIFCRSSTTVHLSLNCYESNDPWPLGTNDSGLSALFTPSKNFFSGALVPGIEKQTTVRAFYSAAVLPRGKRKLWILGTVDGQVQVIDGVTDQTVAKPNWGSDIASVGTGCGQGWQVLVTGNGDGSVETVRAFEFADHEPVVVSQPVEFNGSLTALWSDSDGTGAIAVSQNAETGKYEAYRLSITCSQ
jgi:hypothetical protein